jgi:hypothetical protein
MAQRVEAETDAPAEAKGREQAVAVGTGPDVRIVFWYDRKRPLETFRHQVYDLRKHEYTPAVERWFKRMRERYEGYDAYSRDIVVEREHGDTEKHKIGSAIVREFLVVGSAYGYDFGGFAAGGSRGPGGVSSFHPTPSRPLPRVGTSPFIPVAPSVPFPVPYPYPRPHP